MPMTSSTWSAVAQIQPESAPEQRVSPSRGHSAATWSGVMPTVSASWRQRLPLSVRSGGAALAGAAVASITSTTSAVRPIMAPSSSGVDPGVYAAKLSRGSPWRHFGPGCR